MGEDFFDVGDRGDVFVVDVDGLGFDVALAGGDDEVDGGAAHVGKVIDGLEVAGGAVGVVELDGKAADLAGGDGGGGGLAGMGRGGGAGGDFGGCGADEKRQTREDGKGPCGTYGVVNHAQPSVC